MNRIDRRLLGLISVILIAAFSLTPALQAYDTQAVHDYAWQWRNQINSNYTDYRDYVINQEDANFVSQALIAGGLLNSRNLPVGTPVDAHGCITTREALADFLKDYEHAKAVGFKVDLFVPTSLAHEDVVFFGDAADPYKFVGVVAGYNPVMDDFDIAYHVNTTTYGVVGNVKTLTELMLVYGEATFYHIPKPAETAQDQRFYGGNGFFGAESLSVEILRPGQNYLGYIVNNQNRSEQDMAIATDTSDPNSFKGCSYLISGYCCDPSKSIPSLGQTFGQPWTSDSPDHWAYWVRKAVVYGTEHSSGPSEILGAVWHIVDRAGSIFDYYTIINAIGYPYDGPTKKEMVYLPLLLQPATSAAAAVPTPQDKPVIRTSPPPVQKDFAETFKRKMNSWKEKSSLKPGLN
jgi:hypothetical protein